MGLLTLAEEIGRRVLTRSGVASRWVDTSVARLHVFDAPGRGPLPPIVLLHGLSSSAVPFAPVLQRLRRRARRVLVPEAPGHGESGGARVPLTPDVVFAAMAELLDRELSEPAIVFGNSLGGGVALHYAMHSGPRVRALALASPAGAAMDEAELGSLLDAFEMRTAADARVFMERLYHRVPWFAPLLARDVARLVRREAVVSIRRTARVEHAFSPEQLAALSMPILLLWGRSDRLMPIDNLRWFRRHLPPHAVVEEPEGVGHCPHIDAPRALADRIAAFAAQAVGDRPPSV